MHGAGNINSNADSWARFLNKAGVAVFILDSFSGRGLVGTVEDQTQLDSFALMYDAYRAPRCVDGAPVDTTRQDRGNGILQGGSCRLVLVWSAIPKGLWERR